MVFQVLAGAKKPMIIVGSAMCGRSDGAAIHAAVSMLAQNTRVKSGCGEDWRVLNVLQRVSLLHISSSLA
jgi:NADH dehydrogenase (ubiquinone) Fe-S protein 1